MWLRITVTTMKQGI
uniref:Uncharacterized protein n=1 Tax=Arundo donax TaxID=35708 RepID=A0A0A9BZT3_ARUDO